MFLLFLLVGFPILVGVVIWLVLRNSTPTEEFCPHGYDDFACQPSCPLYENCWVKRDK
ncbi:MAG: hypothetical protein II214_06690 [Alistipes sp.]|nr:hypothetical protein [Alistipes sp.]